METASSWSKEGGGKLTQLREKLETICDNYLSVQQDILETFVDRGQLRIISWHNPQCFPVVNGFPA